jgi:hypothetical protein
MRLIVLCQLLDLHDHFLYYTCILKVLNRLIFHEVKLQLFFISHRYQIVSFSTPVEMVRFSYDNQHINSVM